MDLIIVYEESIPSFLQGGGGLSPEEVQQKARSILDRSRILQSHLCGYEEARAVPVVKLELANFNQTLDRLHDYLLMCIEMAMEQDDARSI